MHLFFKHTLALELENPLSVRFRSVVPQRLILTTDMYQLDLVEEIRVMSDKILSQL